MTTREKILALFESNRDIYFSGEDIAENLSLSRTAVWKAVKSLRNDGYAIDAATNKGYCLSSKTDILSAQGINKYLRPELQDTEIFVADTVVSTNAIVREKANAGRAEGYIVLANEQTEGRGRLKRSFFSPKDTGIYMSLLLRPESCSADQAVRITTMAAVAMCEAIEAVSDEKAGIKWVNDIFIRSRKVCGVLTEGSFDLENGLLDYAVLGLGINIYPPKDGFPEEIESIAGTVFHKPQSDVKNRLVSEFLNRFYGYYSAKDYASYVEKYRSRSLVIGREVTLTSKGSSRSALVLGIDDECHLSVRYPDGTEGHYSSGEISVCF